MSLMDLILGREERKKNQQTRGGGLPEPQKPKPIDLASDFKDGVTVININHSPINIDGYFFSGGSGGYTILPYEPSPDLEEHFAALVKRYSLERLASETLSPVRQERVFEPSSKYQNQNRHPWLETYHINDTSHVVALAALSAGLAVETDPQQRELIAKAGANIAAALEESPLKETYASRVDNIIVKSIGRHVAKFDPAVEQYSKDEMELIKGSVLYKAYQEPVAGFLAEGAKLSKQRHDEQAAMLAEKAKAAQAQAELEAQRRKETHERDLLEARERLDGVASQLKLALKGQEVGKSTPDQLQDHEEGGPLGENGRGYYERD